ncbi:MAG: ATP-binding protein [Phycisphaerae bacterium]|nr:ATP-binding protein [Phycisphaerae bacterium]
MQKTITAYGQTEEKLELFQNLINWSNDCIFIMEPESGLLLDVNDRACAELGYDREDLLNMTFKDIEQTLADDSSWLEQTKKLNDKKELVIQGHHKRKDGTALSTETCLRLVTQNQKPGEELIVAITRNIPKPKQAGQKQDSPEFANQEVEKISQELRDFVYIVSHDLKAPLRGIETLANWISTDYAGKLDDEGKEQITLLVSRVNRMHNLIEGILQYSRVGREEDEKVTVNLNELVSDVIDRIAPPENITITVENELPEIQCGQARITQVFLNLLNNAVNYMDKPKGQIKVACVEEDGFWKFSITDNGPGIEEKHFERIFKIFQTLNPRDELESTGIGLTITKKIVELYNGKIWLESKPGQGTTFFFTLPKQ